MHESTNAPTEEPTGESGPDILHWIDGGRSPGTGNRTTEVTDPATGARTGAVHLATAVDVDRAVRSARTAFEQWRATTLGQRTQVMFTARALLDHHRDELARLVVAEHGKVHADALGEVQRGIEVVEYACGLASLLAGDLTPEVARSVDTYTIRQPLGVVAGITPFNFPVMVPLWMFPMALACGNTFVLKPSEKDPSASLLLAELFADAGVPPGALSVVQGDAEAANALLTHPDVAAVSFVGSTPIARHVYETATAHGKRVQALGGAKNHMVVMPDADVATAADAAVSAGYGSAGERCMAISVIVAVGGVGDALVAAIAERAAALDVGPGRASDAGTGPDMGPLVTAEHRDRVTGYVDRGVAEGAELVVDGRGLLVEDHPDGNWLGPCLFDHVTPDMAIYRDEIFGPVLSVVRVDSYEEALGLVVANPYGNGTAIFTNDGGVARDYEHRVTVGMVGINVPIPVPVASHSFGGWKDSLFGDTHVYGPHGVHFHTRAKAVTARWALPSSTPASSVDLSFPTREP